MACQLFCLPALALSYDEEVERRSTSFQSLGCAVVNHTIHNRWATIHTGVENSDDILLLCLFEELDLVLSRTVDDLLALGLSNEGCYRLVITPRESEGNRLLYLALLVSDPL